MPPPHWDHFSRTCEPTIYGAGVRNWNIDTSLVENVLSLLRATLAILCSPRYYAEIGWSPMLLYLRGSYTPTFYVFIQLQIFSNYHRHLVVMRYELWCELWVMRYGPNRKRWCSRRFQVILNCKSPSDDYNYGYMFDFTDKLNHSQRNVF